MLPKFSIKETSVIFSVSAYFEVTLLIACRDCWKWLVVWYLWPTVSETRR